ncbi:MULTISPECIES: hypothetical protein [Salimicrobium]|uniref:Uncharacterized protein n=1 Tax=Salimicrobium humidisoli TaxID=2029857 RepID=A0ABX4HNH4_9BACI|nr:MULTISPECIES: hypothetical protein [Salimicrobium]PBB04640.1 hypothetical protein CKW00_12995 [Salimicrobium humidisoli]
MTTNNSSEKSPWYLKKGWVYAMCLITPPIGLMNVLLNRNHWKRDEKLSYLGIAIIMGIFWLLKFFPFWVSVVCAIAGYLVIHIWPEEPEQET